MGKLYYISIILILCLAIPCQAVDKWVSWMAGANKYITTTSYTFVPTDGDMGFIPWDGTKFSNITAVYVETNMGISGTCIPNNIATIYWQLYNEDDAVEIASGSFIGISGPPQPRRSSDISSSMPSDDDVLSIRFHNGCQANTTLYSSRLVIIQEADAAPKMRVTIPVGGANAIIATNYTKLGGLSGYEKHYYWDVDDWATIDAVYFGATLKATSGQTAYAKLDIIAGGAGMGEVSTSTSANYVWCMSADISGSIADNTTYTTWVDSDGLFKTVNIRNAMIIVDLSPVTKYQTLGNTNLRGIAGSTEGGSYLVSDAFEYEATDWVGVSKVLTYAATMRVKKVIDTYESSYYEGAVEEAESEISTNSTTYELNESGAISSEPSDGSHINFGRNYIYGDESPTLRGWFVDGDAIVFTVTGIDAETPAGGAQGQVIIIGEAKTWKENSRYGQPVCSWQL